MIFTKPPSPVSEGDTVKGNSQARTRSAAERAARAKGWRSEVGGGGLEVPALTGLGKGRATALLVRLGPEDQGGSREVPVSEETFVPQVQRNSLQIQPVPASVGWSLAAHLTSHPWPSQSQPPSSRPGCPRDCSLVKPLCHETEAGRSPLGATAR